MKRYFLWAVIVLIVVGLMGRRWQIDHRPTPKTLPLDPTVRFSPAKELEPLSDCQMTPDGIRYRVLVAQRQPAVRPDIASDGTTSVSLEPLTPLYVFAFHPSPSAVEFFQVGTTPYRDSILGWMSAETVIPWTTQEVLQVQPWASGRVSQVPVFTDPVGLASRSEPHFESKSPIGWLVRETAGPSGSGWPVLGRTSVSSRDGESTVWYKAALPGAHPVAGGSPRLLPPATAATHLVSSPPVRVDISFLVKNTSQTRPYRFAFVAAARDMIGEAKRRELEPAFVLNPFGTAPSFSGAMVNRRLTGDLRAFTDAVEAFDSPRLDSRVAGLAAAQPAVHGEAYSQRFDPGHISAPTIPVVRRVIRTTDWRPSSLRVVVLFVDQPEPTTPTAAEISHAEVQSLIDEAQRARVHLLTVRLSAGGDLPALRTELLWERIAAETDGRCAVWDESYLPDAWFAAWLSQRMLNDPAAARRGSPDPAEAFTARRGSPDPAEAFDRRSPSPSDTENLNAPFTGRLRRVDGSDTSSDVVRAWIPAQIDGTPLVQRIVFLGNEERATLHAELDALRGYLLRDGRERQTEEIPDPRCYFACPRASSFLEHLRERGIPHVSTGLNRTQRELAAMPDHARRAVINEFERWMARPLPPSGAAAR